MRLIDDHDRFDVLNALQELNLAVQSSFGVAAIETTFCAELSKDAVVEVSRCQLRICKIEGPISAAVQLVNMPLKKCTLTADNSASIPRK